MGARSGGKEREREGRHLNNDFDFQTDTSGSSEGGGGKMLRVKSYTSYIIGERKILAPK